MGEEDWRMSGELSRYIDGGERRSRFLVVGFFVLLEDVPRSRGLLELVPRLLVSGERQAMIWFRFLLEETSSTLFVLVALRTQ